MCAIEDKTAVVVVASYRSVSRNPVRFKALHVHASLESNQSAVELGKCMHSYDWSDNETRLFLVY